MAVTIKPLTKAEHDWIRKHLDAAEAFVAGFCPDGVCDGVSLTSLDRSFGDWLATEPSGPDQVEATIDAVSAAFGQLLVQHLDMRWVVAQDGQRSSLAVHALPGAGDVLIYPQEVVAKHWQRREKDFLRPAYHQIAAHLKSLRK